MRIQAPNSQTAPLCPCPPPYAPQVLFIGVPRFQPSLWPTTGVVCLLSLPSWGRGRQTLTSSFQRGRGAEINPNGPAPTSAPAHRLPAATWDLAPSSSVPRSWPCWVLHLHICAHDAYTFVHRVHAHRHILMHTHTCTHMRACTWAHSAVAQTSQSPGQRRKPVEEEFLVDSERDLLCPTLWNPSHPPWDLLWDGLEPFCGAGPPWQGSSKGRSLSWGPGPWIPIHYVCMVLSVGIWDRYSGSADVHLGRFSPGEAES